MSSRNARSSADGARRRPVDRRIDDRCRFAARIAERADGAVAEAVAARDEARAVIDARWAEECDRFGRALPLDPFLLDRLALIDLEAGDVWRWRGVRNNKGLPTVRMSRPHAVELSAVRYLAVRLGVIGEEDYGILYPSNGDPEDVNPWHRTLRRSEHAVRGPGYTADRFLPGGRVRGETA